jgi:chaperonin GroEL
MATKVQSNNIKDIIIETVNEIVDFVKVTYGPAGNKVMINSPYGRRIVDDGLEIVKAYKSDCDVKNAIIDHIKDMSIKTNEKVGDGSTSNLIMLQALMKEIAKSSKTPREIEEELQKGLIEFKKQLQSKAKKATNLSDLKAIARISYNDEQIATLIAELVYDLGPDGVITVENSSTTETTVERLEGLEMSSGYESQYMVNNPKMTCELNKPLILVCDYRITEAEDIQPLLEKVLKAGKRTLVIVADKVESKALNLMVQNNSTVFNAETKKPGPLNLLAVSIPPGDKAEFVQDLARITGAEPITHDKGIDFTTLELSHLGSCEKVVATNSMTAFIGCKGDKKEINSAVKTLKEAITKATTAYEKQKLQVRLAKYTNGVAIVKVGASTDNELNAKKEKIDDAINAVKSAYRGGIVCGGGLSLGRITTTSTILNKALKYPYNQLKENSEIETEAHELKENQAINAITKEVGDYMKLGIIDPVDVLIAGVDSAVSIASLLITTKGLIYEAKEKE